LCERAKSERDRQQAAIEAMEAPDGPGLARDGQALRALRAGLAEVGSKRAALEGRVIAHDTVARLLEDRVPRRSAAARIRSMPGLRVRG